MSIDRLTRVNELLRREIAEALFQIMGKEGSGFDLDEIDEDRRGVRDSIKARMQRHGGSASIDSEIGIGTEVHLTMTGGSA